MNLNPFLAYLSKSRVKYETDVSMAGITTFRVGGIAPICVYPETVTQVAGVVRYLYLNGIPYYVIGNGSDLLVRDTVPDVVFIRMTRLNGMEIDGSTLTLDAGCLNSAVANTALSLGLTGYEFAHGIPGTVGGAVIMNAGAYGKSFDEILQKVIFVDQYGLIRSYKKDATDFGYRKSPFDGFNFVVCQATVKLRMGDKTEIRAKMDELMQKRRASQPLEFPSAGSTFKRPVGYFAGKLIEDAGLKGYTVGGAQVSEKHAGFVINRHNATSQDVLDVIEHVQKTVFEKFGVTLETEVRII